MVGDKAIMQVVNGRAKEQSMSIQDLLKRVPTRLIKFMLRVASLQRGRYVILLGVGEDEIEWSVSQVGRVER